MGNTISLVKSQPLRIPIGKKVRFTIFKRDCFTCQYCGNTPPRVVLEIDHIIPVVEGGNNKPANLITACFDCNRGKGPTLLTSVPDSIERMAELMREKQDQIKSYTKLLRSIEKQHIAIIERVEEVFNLYFPNRCFTETFSDSIKVNFTPYLLEDQLIFAMSAACNKRRDSSSSAIKYFCGICWNKIRGQNGPRS